MVRGWWLVQLTLPWRVGGDVVGPRRGTAHPVRRPRGIREQSLAESGERALELAAQRRQIVNHQRELRGPSSS